MSQSSDEDSGGAAHRCRSSPPLTKKERLAKGRAKQQLKLEGAHATITSLQERVAELEAARDRHQHMLSQSLHKPAAQRAAADAIYGACARSGLSNNTAHALATAASGAFANLAAASSYTLVSFPIHQPPGLDPADGSHAEAMVSAAAGLGTFHHSSSVPETFCIFDADDAAWQTPHKLQDKDLDSQNLAQFRPLPSQASTVLLDRPISHTATDLDAGVTPVGSRCVGNAGRASLACSSDDAFPELLQHEGIGSKDFKSQHLANFGVDCDSQNLANLSQTTADVARPMAISGGEAVASPAPGLQLPAFHLHNSGMAVEYGGGTSIKTLGATVASRSCDANGKHGLHVIDLNSQSLANKVEPSVETRSVALPTANGSAMDSEHMTGVAGLGHELANQSVLSHGACGVVQCGPLPSSVKQVEHHDGETLQDTSGIAAHASLRVLDANSEDALSALKDFNSQDLACTSAFHPGAEAVASAAPGSLGVGSPQTTPSTPGSSSPGSSNCAVFSYSTINEEKASRGGVCDDNSGNMPCGRSATAQTQCGRFATVSGQAELSVAFSQGGPAQDASLSQHTRALDVNFQNLANICVDASSNQVRSGAIAEVLADASIGLKHFNSQNLANSCVDISSKPALPELVDTIADPAAACVESVGQLESADAVKPRPGAVARPGLQHEGNSPLLDFVSQAQYVLKLERSWEILNANLSRDNPEYDSLFTCCLTQLEDARRKLQELRQST